MSEEKSPDLKGAIATMRRDACTSLRPFTVKAWHLPQLKSAEKWLDKMASHVDPTVNLQEILAKLLRDEPLTYKEIRNIPYSLHDEACSMELLQKAIKLLHLERARHCHRLLCAYVWRYDASEKTHAIAKVLRTALRRSPPPAHQRFLCHAAEQPDLFFGAKSVKLMAELLYMKENVAAWLASFALPQTLKGGDFFLRVLQTYYEDPLFSLEKQYALFREIKKDSAYSRLLPTAASCLIPKVDEAEPTLKSKWKNELLDDFYRSWGDPRFTVNHVSWQPVSETAKRIFLRWIAERDMNLFFEIVQKTAVDPAWPYRKTFWQKYLPYISNTRVFFGSHAIRYARRLRTQEETLSFGRYSGGFSDQSVFAFELDRYIFIEWSHKGSLRVFGKEHAQQIFDDTTCLTREEVFSWNPLEYWRHAGKEKNRWQENVAGWIDENCTLG